MKVNILGVKIDKLTQSQSLEKIDAFLNSNKQHHIITANPEIVLEAWQNEKYRDLINQSSLVLADGIGLLWAAKFLSLKSNSLLSLMAQLIVSGSSLVFYPEYCREVLPERIAGVDLMEKICEQASKKGWKVYLLGGEQGIAQKTAEVLKKKYLNLNIVGAEEGLNFQLPINNSQSNPNFQGPINNINEKKPDILFVAFGAPKQDLFINEYLKKMPSVKLAMGVGGAFDFTSGKTKRAPQVYRDLGLEWLHRLFHEPWRAVRIFNATVRFVWNVVRFKHVVKKSKNQ